ncbi:sulfite exporter TauE/SafE family protein [Halomicroarcula limicola]|uniref:Probable membrane transporter protein n=1 Tax=Haloarcula limicola TaxID=1429915 RepID=A0A8J7Y953_9EURY|nr:sulfite exporter TauE/SafE family protein [Halomicroarcula limicola]MBV0924093.1 sulfite exporter TauE/SafE family protein [Halomicroarcula limicola]
MTSSSPTGSIQKTFLKYQHVFVFLAPLAFVVGVYFFAPTSPADPGTGYWLEYWWLFLAFIVGATIVNTVGISGSALFVPFLIFVFPVVAGETLTPETLVKIGLISESFGLSSSALAFIQYGLVDRRLALTLVGGGIPFVVAGALLSFVIPAPVFHAMLGLALIAASYLLFKADLAHEEPESSGDESSVSADGGTDDGLPNDDDKLGPAGVEKDDSGTVTRVDRDGNDYGYSHGGYLERFANYSIGGVFQGLAGFGIGELGIISMLRTDVPVRVAIGTNHIVVATTAILASLVHVFGGSLVPGAHSISLASTPWNMVVWTVPATATGGQIAPYVSAALDTEIIKKGVGALFAIISVALFLMAGGAF